MTTKIIAVGMIDYPEAKHYLSVPLIFLNSKVEYEVISFEDEKQEMYDKIVSKADDAAEVMDALFDKYLNALDAADVLLLINPKPIADLDDKHIERLQRNFNGWMSYLAGYAYSQGVVVVYYADNEETVLHPLIKRQTHTVLNTVSELLNYDFKALPTQHTSKMLLPVKTAGGF